MRSSVVRLLSQVLVLLILTGAAPALAGAQETPEAGQGVYFQQLFNSQDFTGQPTEGHELDLYEFTFEPQAWLPESEALPQGPAGSPGISREAMTVFVDSNPFVLYTPLDMAEGAVVVYSYDGNPVNVEEWSSPDTLESAEPCASPCTVPPNRYVLIQPGGYALHQENSGCTY